MFGTSGIRGRVGESVTAALALSVGRSLGAAGYERVVLGRDPRASGAILSDALAAGIRETGSDVLRVGQAATPTVARAVGWMDADAGVVVTASHNPAPDNGVKLWRGSGRAFDESQQAEIESWVRAFRDGDDAAVDALVDHDSLGAERRPTGMTSRHERALVDTVRRRNDEADVGDLSDLSIVVDVGNGAGGVTADALDALGAAVSTLNAQPDGTFPGRPSEPTAANCEALSAFVAATDADLGVAHDGDADRMMAVTGDGEFVQGDVLLAIFATAAARAVGPDCRVASPLNTSLAVDDALESVHAELVHTRVGDGYVAERATDDDVVFGGEMSGAWIWPDDTLCPDGPLAACRLAALVTRRGPLSGLVDEVPTYPTRRDAIEVSDKGAVMEAVAERVSSAYDERAIEDSDGVRVDTADGWFLLRASGTQPLVRVTAEARDDARSDSLANEARQYLDDAIDALE